MAGKEDAAADPGDRQRDAERTRAELLEVATAEFARNGYSGARVDEIAARTRTTKRMIYYYFGGKENLYIAVLERAYEGIREHERRLEMSHLSPTAAVRRLIEFTFDYQESHPEFIKLVSIENIHEAEYLAKSDALVPTNSSAVDLLAEFLDAGRATGEFTVTVTALELHMMISALCFFRVANRPSLKAVFGYDTGTKAHRARQRQLTCDIVLAYLKS
ncbi:MAG TPA: TetR/AcrR family transcriptional regulator [Acidothermaceae bacterium]